MNALRISTDRDELDIPLIHRFLSQDSHWVQGVSIELVRKSNAHSFCFGGFLGESQIAFGRVVTDFAYFGYLRDLFVIEEHREKGYGKALIQAILTHSDLTGLTFLLRTSDASTLYAKFGFTTLPNPEKYMRRAAVDA